MAGVHVRCAGNRSARTARTALTLCKQSAPFGPSPFALRLASRSLPRNADQRMPVVAYPVLSYRRMGKGLQAAGRTQQTFHLEIQEKRTSRILKSASMDTVSSDWPRKIEMKIFEVGNP